MDFFSKKKEGITEFIEHKAKSNPKRIVYPEIEDDRILKAAEIVSKKKSAQIILLGNPETIKKREKELKLNLSKVLIVDFEKSEKLKDYSQKFYELRKHKGMTPEEAGEIMQNSRYFGTMMVYFGDADGMVSGASHSTADTLKPALQIIKTKDDTKYASSFFIMAKEDSVFFFADCAFIQDPNVEELTSIAIQTAESAKKFGYEPRIAMLSFSTKGSADGPILEKVRKATNEIKRQRPELVIDGEMQLDAAIVPDVAKKKCPDSPIQGNANVLIFPDLNAGNIGYKLVERFGHTHAIGPVVQGLKRPVNDLSRGCSVEDVVLTTEVTVMQAQDVLETGAIKQDGIDASAQTISAEPEKSEISKVDVSKKSPKKKIAKTNKPKKKTANTKSKEKKR
jgi:phosphate acetyltransferase